MTRPVDADKDRSMELQKEMIAEHFNRLERAPETKEPVVYTFVQVAFLNGFLALFNLLPIPPLDGGQIVLQLLPPEWADRYSAVGRYGFMIVLGLAVINVLWVPNPDAPQRGG